MGVILIVLAILVAAAAFWFVGARPAVHRQLTSARLEKLLSALLNRGVDGGALFIRGKAENPFVQVMKYERRGQIGLRLDFPRVPWSAPYVDAVEDLLRTYGALPTRGWTGQSNDLELITVDFGIDVKRATACVERLAEDVLQLPLEREGRAHFIGVRAQST